MAHRSSRWAIGTVAVGFGILVAVLALSVNSHAANGDDESESRIKRGFEIAPGGDPFQGEAPIVNQSTYLAGGTFLFGPFVPRNLTPDKTGRPEGGASFEECLNILRTGVDPDKAHPQFGPLLQVMPWPTFHNMTDHDIRAIYEYLSAIPCIEGDPGLPDPRPIGTRCK